MPGFERARQLDRAALFEREFVRRQRTGNARRQRSGLAGVRHRFAVANEHVPVRGGRRHLAAIDGREFAVGRSNQNQATAADARVVAIDHAERERRRHRRVDRVAAVAKNFNAGIGGNRMNGRDHVVFGSGSVGERCSLAHSAFNSNTPDRAQPATDITPRRRSAVMRSRRLLIELKLFHPLAISLPGLSRPSCSISPTSRLP